MYNKNIYIIILTLILVPFLLAAGPLEYPQKVNPGGELEHRVRLTEKRVQHQPFDLDLLVQDVARKPDLQRRFEEYEGDVSGRTLGCWSYLARLLGEHPQKLDDLFEEIVQYQSSDGYFGQDQKKIDWDYWGRQTFGHGRLLGGLVQYYLLTQNQRALESAIKLGDYFVRSIPEWTITHAENPWTDHEKWVLWHDAQSNRRHFVKTHMTSILESLMMLHDINPKPEYLAAGTALVDLFPDFGHYHSHSYMNSMTGMAMLYARTGDREVFKRLTNLYWQDIMQHGYAIDGGMREWFPDDHRTEGCSITDWIRLNVAMWSITQEAVYLDEAENAWYNGLNFHQTANGAFGHALCSPTGYEAEYSEAWWCCTMHGLWAYADIINCATVAGDDHLWFNFYAPLSFEIKNARFETITAYPQEGHITILCSAGGTTTLANHLRIPKWAEDFDIKINGEQISGIISDGTFTFQHAWKNGDKLELNLPLTLRLVDCRGNNVLKRRSLGDHIYGVSFFYGPLLLGADTKHNHSMPDEILFVEHKNYRIPGQAGAFSLPNAHFMIPAVSNNFQSATILVPISEQTGYQEWTDAWRNFERNGEKPILREAVQIVHKVRVKHTRAE
ncbi:glycoside hydrolase family 127 protein [candidate division KSB1 bacterium]|nr:glycoside hydrolase family 127 protein [candidate division KSB1 bacterium]